MTHYEERLQADLEGIVSDLQAVTQLIDSNLERATTAFKSLDRDLASESILQDQPINRAIRRLDHDCHAFVARHLPSARHLRFVSSALRLNIELERIGDYAASVARETVQLTRLPKSQVVQQIEDLSSRSRRLLRDAVQAFATDSVESAQRVMKEASGMEASFAEAFRTLTLGDTPHQLSAPDLTALLVILNRFSRVRAQAKNVAEETLFVTTGQPLPPKTYRLLFLDKSGGDLAALAVAYAGKAFPESGQYDGAAVSGESSVGPDVVAAAAENGLSADREACGSLQDAGDLQRYHMIVGLEPGLRDQVPTIPFHTIFLGRPVDPAQGGQALIKDIAAVVSTLMTTLKGDEAS